MQPSFSNRQRLAIGLRTVVTVLLVMLVLAIVNYFSRTYFYRANMSTGTRVELSTRTAHFLKSITNHIKVTVYFDKSEPLYSTIADLLKEYHLANRRITVQTVDYLRDAGAAQKVKNAYQLSGADDKNLVIFEAEGGRHKIVDAKALAHYTLEQVPHEKERVLRRKPVAFLGDMAFSAALLDVTNPKPLTAYYVIGHREHDIESGDAVSGYLDFASLLKQNYVRLNTLSLAGTNPIPEDCNLLIIAGPLVPMPEPELEKIGTYLVQGGRLMALLNSASLHRDSGLERVLANFGVGCGNRIVLDPDHSQSGSDVIVSAFSKHPLVNPLLGTGLYMIAPRPVGKAASENQSAEAPKVEEVAFTGPDAFLLGDPSNKRLFPLMVAVERSTAKGVISQRGNVRMVVAGDSMFFANQQLALLGNRDFAQHAVNWLLERSELLGGVGPRPIKEYRVLMSQSQLRSAQWLLLGAMPGAFLLIGALVWLKRRR